MAAVSGGLDVIVKVELTTLDSVVVVVVVPEGTSGAAPDANTPGSTLGGALGMEALPASTIVLGMLLMPGTTVPVVVNVLPKNTVQAPAPEALYAPGTPHVPPPPLNHPPAINDAAGTKDTLHNMSVMVQAAREEKDGAPYVGAGAGAPAGGPETAGAAPYAGAAEGAPAAFATPVTTACSTGIDDKPGMKFGIDVVQIGQLPRPPALAGTAGHDIALQGMQLDEAAAAGAMGQVVTYAVAVTTLASQGATAVTVIWNIISNHIPYQ